MRQLRRFLQRLPCTCGHLVNQRCRGRRIAVHEPGPGVADRWRGRQGIAGRHHARPARSLVGRRQRPRPRASATREAPRTSALKSIDNLRQSARASHLSTRPHLVLGSRRSFSDEPALQVGIQSEPFRLLPQASRSSVVRPAAPNACSCCVATADDAAEVPLPHIAGDILSGVTWPGRGPRAPGGSPSRQGRRPDAAAALFRVEHRPVRGVERVRRGVPIEHHHPKRRPDRDLAASDHQRLA